jgi:2'-5' RNA ligase
VISGCNGGGPYNSFAVVGYVPEPAGEFINRLRREFEPDRAVRAHITILPPRPLPGPPDEAWRQLCESLSDFHAPHIELGEVKIFPDSKVIYLSIRAGYEDLEHMHKHLDRGLCRGDEAWRYCPHITLARFEEAQDLAANFNLASRRWEEFRYARDFTLDEVTFVQNTSGEDWTDLERFRLAPKLAPEPVAESIK